MSKIYEFNPVIYPFRLYVAVDMTNKDILDGFNYFDIDKCEVIEFTESDLRVKESNVSTCLPVTNKENDDIGVLLRIHRKKDFDIGFISHEANHICDFACEHLGIYHKGFYKGEAASYLVQWIANCINSVKRNKVKTIEVNT